MSTKYYLLSITFLLFVRFARSDNETSTITDHTTVADLVTSESVASSLSTSLMSSDTLHSTTNLMPSSSNENPNVTDPSATNNPSSITSITSPTSIISTGIPSTTPTTVIRTNRNETYNYPFKSEHDLQTGIINDSTVIKAVQGMVDDSFNLTGFSKTVTKIVIELIPKARTNDYNMLVDIWFTSTRNDCDLACIDNATLTPTMSISLPLENSTLVSVNFASKPVRVTNPTITRLIGGPSPGVPAQLGMGLGISLFGVLLIAEIILFARMFG